MPGKDCPTATLSARRLGSKKQDVTMRSQIDGLDLSCSSRKDHRATPANDNRAELRGVGGGLRAIMFWHLSVLAIGAGLVLVGIFVTRLAQSVTGMRG